MQAEPEAFERIGEEVTEEPDVLPMTVILTAALPPRVVPGGLPAAGLIAFLRVAKYVEHLPLYRLEKAFAQRFGVRLKRPRMCDGIGYAIENGLAIISHSIRQGLIGGDYLQIDETPIRYLDAHRKGKSASGYLWV